MQQQGEREILSYLAAMRRIADPHRSILAESSPVIMTGGRPLDLQEMLAGARAAHGFDADFLHMEFAPGEEARGPVNIAFASMRDDVVCMTRRHCTLWLGKDGVFLLLAQCGSKWATMTFDKDGLDSRPGKPAGSLANGFKRAATRLRVLAAAAKSSAANDVAPADGTRAAA